MDWISVDDKLPDCLERNCSLCVKTSTGDIYYLCNYLGNCDWDTFLIKDNSWKYLYHRNTDLISEHLDGSGKKIIIGLAGKSIEKFGVVTHWAVDNNRGSKSMLEKKSCIDCGKQIFSRGNLCLSCSIRRELALIKRQEQDQKDIERKKLIDDIANAVVEKLK